ncbi:MAG: hypothetical protein M3O34_07040 [Chloroflexota bacterium]|nr:hypothetical protein [Chloroflexota bacterium]
MNDNALTNGELDDEDDAPPIGLSSKELAYMLGQAMIELREENPNLDDSKLVILVSAAIEANNRKIYEDLLDMGLVEEIDEDDA